MVCCAEDVRLSSVSVFPCVLNCSCCCLHSLPSERRPLSIASRRSTRPRGLSSAPASPNTHTLHFLHTRSHTFSHTQGMGGRDSKTLLTHGARWWSVPTRRARAQPVREPRCSADPRSVTTIRCTGDRPLQVMGGSLRSLSLHRRSSPQTATLVASGDNPHFRTRFAALRYSTGCPPTCKLHSK